MMIPIDEICEFINGGAWSDKEYVAIGIPVLKVSNLHRDGIDVSNINYIPYSSKDKYAKHLLFRDDLVIATVGSHPTLVNSAAGRASIIPKSVEGYLLNQNAVCLRTKNELILCQRYLAYLGKTEEFQNFIQQRGRGAANQMRIAISSIKEFKINLPPLSTQRRIASILSAYDDLIENNLKRIKLLEELAQRTYEEWFVKFCINGEPLPIDEKTGLPVGWEKRPLNEIAEIISGFAFKSGDYVKDGKYKIVTIKNVQDGYFIPETTDSLIEVPSKVKQSQILKSGDIILSLTGNVGRSCLVFGQNYLLNQRVAKLVAKRPEFYSYMYFLLRSKSMVVALENLSNGAAQQNLSPINMGNYRVTIPDNEVLNTYSNQFNNYVELICQLYNEITLLKESRDILLPRLMSGKINVE